MQSANHTCAGAGDSLSGQPDPDTEAEGSELDKEDEEGAEGAVDYTDLLADLGQDEGDGLDDATAEDLESGFDIDDTETSIEGDGPTELDLGVLVDTGVEDGSGDADDASGPLDVDPTIGIEPPEQPAEGDDELDLDVGQLSSEVLPPLQAEPGDDEEGTGETLLFVELEADETAARREPWPVLGLDLPPGPKRGIYVADDGVFLVGRTVIRCDRTGQLEELASTSTTLTTIVPARTALIATTITGEVLRIENGSVQAESQWRRSAGLSADEAVDVRAVGDAERVRLWTSAGVVLELDAALDRTTRVPIEGRVVAMSRARPYWFVIETPEGYVIARESSPGALVLADATGTRPLLADGCLIEATEGLIAIARPGVGAAVSTNGGQRFSMLPGLGRVTAIAIGDLPGGPQLFAGTYNATSNSAKLYRVDPMSRDVSELGEVRAADEDDDAGVAGLSFDDAERALWAVGSFGVRVLRRPD